jgi:UPF0755 protein
MARILALIAFIAVVAVLAAAGSLYYLYSFINAPVTHAKATEYIKIEKGSTPPQVLAQLASQGIISSETTASLYLRILGDPSRFQAGEYQFPSPITPADVFKQLEKGEERTIRLTIPEGFTRFDIAKRLSERLTPERTADEATILALMDDTSLIKDIAPEAKNLEGYMYPSTYNVPREARPADAIRQMVEQFRRFWKPEWTAQAKAMGRTPHQMITIASLIETESPVDAERPIVAGVINNRLARNIPLGIDQTNVYIAKMLGRWDGTIHKSDLEVDSPYNTRKVAGLPPGPISSVTESSIRAALAPAEHDHIFYVLNVDANDGTHWFYASAAEFEKGKAKYQKWLAEQRQLKRAAEQSPGQ